MRSFNDNDIESAIAIWNDIVEEGIAFPQTDNLTIATGLEFFHSQSHTGVAYDVNTNKIVGLYILHPNNVGRCGHICNTSYAVSSSARGGGVGRYLVENSIIIGKELGFKILQFNAVVATNHTALRLYKNLGFTQLGVIPKGFLLKDGTYEDIIPHFIEL